VLEPDRVDVVGVDRQPVTLVDAFDAGRRTGDRPNGVPQPGDVAGQGTFRAGRGVVAPRRLDQGVHRNDGPRSRRQRAEQSPWDRPPHRDRTVRSVHGQGPQDPQQHGFHGSADVELSG
jgi:hypothetical protein